MESSEGSPLSNKEKDKELLYKQYLFPEHRDDIIQELRKIVSERQKNPQSLTLFRSGVNELGTGEIYIDQDSKLPRIKGNSLRPMVLEYRVGKGCKILMRNLMKILMN